MQVLGQREYAGEILGKMEQSDIFASITRYRQHQFNKARHCHENARISFVMRAVVLNRKKSYTNACPAPRLFIFAASHAK